MNHFNGVRRTIGIGVRRTIGIGVRRTIGIGVRRITGMVSECYRNFQLGKGIKTEKGSYGHMGASDREFDVLRKNCS